MTTETLSGLLWTTMLFSALSALFYFEHWAVDAVALTFVINGTLVELTRLIDKVMDK